MGLRLLGVELSSTGGMGLQIPMDKQPYLSWSDFQKSSDGQMAPASMPKRCAAALFPRLSCMACGLAVWYLAVPVCLLLAAVCTAVYILVWCVPWWLWMAVRGRALEEWTCAKENADAVEDKVIQQMYPLGTRSEWIDLEPRQKKSSGSAFACAEWKAHRIVIPYQGDAPSAPTLLVIHGSGSAATLMMSSCAHKLSAKFTLHGIDLPGYGRTEMPAGMSCADAEKLSAKELINMQAEFIERYCLTCGLHRPLVASHSAGAT